MQQFIGPIFLILRNRDLNTNHSYLEEQRRVLSNPDGSTQTPNNNVNSAGDSAASRRGENSRNLILLLISALFLICLSPRFPGFYYYYTFAKLNEECTPAYEYINSKCTNTPTMLNETLPFDPITVEYPQWLWGISPIANLGLLINSAANWLIYIYAGSRFRKIFTRKLSPIFSFLRKVFCVDRIRNINSSNNAGMCKIYLIVDMVAGEFYENLGFGACLTRQPHLPKIVCILCIL